MHLISRNTLQNVRKILDWVIGCGGSYIRLKIIPLCPIKVFYCCPLRPCRISEKLIEFHLTFKNLFLAQSLVKMCMNLEFFENKITAIKMGYLNVNLLTFNIPLNLTKISGRILSTKILNFWSRFGKKFLLFRTMVLLIENLAS